MKSNELSLSQARRIAIAAQGFGGNRQQTSAAWPRMRRTIERMGLLQIDSISAVVRSHYLPVFSRAGHYDRSTLDKRSFDPHHRELFEYWGHEASLLPLALHPLLRWRMAKAERLEGIYGRIAKFVAERRDYVDKVLVEIGNRGPLSARELNHDGQRSGSWQWHEPKLALEYLFWSGRVTAVTRRNFERIYDLTERALPDDIVALPTPSKDQAQRELIRLSGRAMGVATESDLRDYFRLTANDAKLRVAELVEGGDLLAIRVEGWRQPAYLDPNARTPRRVQGASLLSPFDPLVWERSRIERLFDFHYRLEIYTPAAKRRYGYYVLPFLLDEHLVARVDLKADLPSRTLRVLAAYEEAGVKSKVVAGALAIELQQLATWLGLHRVTVGRRGNLASALRPEVNRTTTST